MRREAVVEGADDERRFEERVRKGAEVGKAIVGPDDPAAPQVLFHAAAAGPAYSVRGNGSVVRVAEEVPGLAHRPELEALPGDAASGEDKSVGICENAD